MIRSLQNLCEKLRCQSESNIFIYSFETMSIKKHQGLSTYPSSTVRIFNEHVMLLGMNLTSNHLNYNIQRKQKNSFTIFVDRKKQSDACRVKFSKCETFKKQGQSSLVIVIHMLS